MAVVKYQHIPNSKREQSIRARQSIMNTGGTKLVVKKLNSPGPGPAPAQTAVATVNATKVSRTRKATFHKRWDDKTKSCFWRCTICFQKLRSRHEVHWYHSKPRVVLQLFRCCKCSHKEIRPVKLKRKLDSHKKTYQYHSKSKISYNFDLKFKCSNCKLSKQNQASVSVGNGSRQGFQNEKKKVQIEGHPVLVPGIIKVENDSDSEINMIAQLQTPLNCTPNPNSSEIKVNKSNNQRGSSSPDISLFRCSTRILSKNDINNTSTSTSSVSAISIISHTGTGQEDPSSSEIKRHCRSEKATSSIINMPNFIHDSVIVNRDDKAEFIHGDVADTADLHGYLSAACEQIFQEPEKETEQIFKIHTRIMNLVHKCDHCNKRFKSRGELRSHLPIHFEDRPYGCELCGQRFKQQQGLRVHLFTHRSDTPYGCANCDRSFKTIAHLKSHTLTHSEVKQFMCKFCGKSFKQSTTLINHEKTHMADKPYKCDECGNCFKIKSTLDRHILTHTDERRFSCQYCSKKFKRSDALKAHERIHVCNN